MSFFYEEAAKKHNWFDQNNEDKLDIEKIPCGVNVTPFIWDYRNGPRFPLAHYLI